MLVLSVDMAGDEEEIAAPPGDLKYHAQLMPNKLNLATDKGDAFVVWETRWKDYEALSKLKARPVNEQLALLRRCLSDDTLKVMLNLKLSDADKDDTDKIIEALKVHSHGKVNVVIERRSFNLRVQSSTESFDDYLTALRELVKTCDFCEDCCPTLIRDRIVTGIRDGEVIKKLLATDALDLDKTIATCRAEEAAIKHKAEIVSESQSTYEVGKVSTYKKAKKDAAQRKYRSDEKHYWDPCFKCNKKHVAGNEHCPAKDSKCARCHEKGHWAKSKTCKKNKKSVQSVSVKSLGSIVANIDGRMHGPAPKVEVKIEGEVANGATIRATPDSGADRTARGKNILEILGIDENNLREPSIDLTSADGNEMNQIGEFDAVIRAGDKTVVDTIHVFNNISGFYLSWYSSRGLGYLPQEYPQQITRGDTVAASVVVDEHITRDELINMFPDVFSEEIKVMPGEEFKIELTDDAVPFCVKTARTVPYAYRG